MGERITRWLKNSPSLVFLAYAVGTAFTVYFCMYAFRKPFTVALFSGKAGFSFLPGLDYKIALIIAQVIGYTISKFYGVKFISEVSRKYRGRSIFILISIAQLSLLGFAMVERPWQLIFIFINGLPLGMIWGLVFGFLEGRKFSEFLGAGLSASYIVASGFMKTVGGSFLTGKLEWGGSAWWAVSIGWFKVSEDWMPFFSGLLFLPIIAIAIYLLRQLPPPNEEDIKSRTKREPMFAEERGRFLKLYAPGIAALTALYFFLTAYRSLRDDFAREIWDALGFQDKPAIFALSEMPIAFTVLLVLGLMYKIQSNRKALAVIFCVMIAGSGIILVSTLLFQMKLMGGATWMIMVGLGLYLAYVPYGCMLFDRMIAAIGFVGTAGFMIYVTDAFGYVGTVAVLIYKNVFAVDVSWLSFFVGISYFTGAFCLACFLFGLYYFLSKSKAEEAG